MSGPMNESAPERVTADLTGVSKKIVVVLVKGKAGDGASEGVMMPASTNSSRTVRGDDNETQ